MGLIQKLILVPILIIGIGLAGSSLPVLPHESGAGSKELMDQIRKEKDELNQLKKRIEGRQDKRRAARKKEKSILSRLEEVDHKVSIKRKELSLINLKLQKHVELIEELGRELEVLGHSVEVMRDRVRKGIRILYQESRRSALRALFVSQDYYDFLRQYNYLARISQKEGEVLSNYRSILKRRLHAKEEIRDAKEHLLEDRRQVQDKIKEIKAGKKKKSRMLASIRKEKRVHDRMIQELEESRGQIKRLITELEKKRKQTSASAGFPKMKGKIGWPAKGRVTAFFGRQKHPKFDTLIDRKGIEIQSKQGAPIRAVYGGTVVYSDWFRGFGLLIILDHGENYYSLYAHAAKLAVSVGDRVKARKVIGEIGDTGFTGDSSLYFEIRHGGIPENPLTWLKKK